MLGTLEVVRQTPKNYVADTSESVLADIVLVECCILNHYLTVDITHVITVHLLQHHIKC